MFTIRSYTSSSTTSHNSLSFRSKVNYLYIRSIYTIDHNNTKIVLVNKPIELNNIGATFGITYKNIVSKIIYFDIDLNVDVPVTDLLDIKVTANRYKTYGEYISQYKKLSSGKFIQPIFKVEHASDTFIDCNLHLVAFDKFNNIRIDDIIPIIMNDDGKLAFVSDSQSVEFKLPTEIDNKDDMSIFVEDTIEVSKNNYSLIDSRTIQFDTRNLDRFLVIYRPKFYTDNNDFYPIGPNLEINKNNIIKSLIRDLDHIEYRFIIKMLNLNFRTIDETPVIKTLGLITY